MLYPAELQAHWVVPSETEPDFTSSVPVTCLGSQSVKRPCDHRWARALHVRREAGVLSQARSESPMPCQFATYQAWPTRADMRTDRRRTIRLDAATQAAGPRASRLAWTTGHDPVNNECRRTRRRAATESGTLWTAVVDAGD